MSNFDSLISVSNIISDPCSIIDTEGKIIFANTSMLNCVNCSEDIILNKNIFDIFIPNIGANKSIDSFFNTNNNTLLGRIIFPNTTEILCQVNAIKTVLTDTYIIVLIFKEIKNVYNKEEIFETIFYQNTIPMILSTLDEGVVIDVNQSCLELFQYNKNEVVGEFASKYFSNSTDFPREEIIQKLLNGTSIKDYQVKFNTKNNLELVCQISISLFTIEKKRYVLTTIKDISKVVEYENKLNASNQKFYTIFNYSPIGMLLFNNIGDLLEINQSALDIFGINEIDKSKINNFFSDILKFEELKNCIKNNEIQKYTIEFNFDNQVEFFKSISINKGVIFYRYYIYSSFY